MTAEPLPAPLLRFLSDQASVRRGRHFTRARPLPPDGTGRLVVEQLGPVVGPLPRLEGRRLAILTPGPNRAGRRRR